MALGLYLIGAPQCGKTAIFDALTHTPEGPNFMTKGGHRYGTVKVPDERLGKLRDLFKPKKYTPRRSRSWTSPHPAARRSSSAT